MRFGTLAFDRFKGAQSDVKELEFVSALMQTDETLRVDGTLRPQDIALYLHSRFGLDVTVDTVEKLIFKELAGCTIPTKEESTLDLCQFVALLLVPVLLDGDTNKEPLKWFKEAFREAGGTGELTRMSLRAVFESFDEFGVDDEVLDAMIQVAGDGSLEQALTGDLGQFDLEWKNQYATNLEKVILLQPTPKAEFSLEDTESMENVAQRTESTQQDAYLLRQKVTAPFVDFIAENYNRHSFVMLLWGAGIMTYVAYIFGVTDSGSYDYWAEVNCADKLSESGCAIVKGVVSWLATMVQLATLGFAFIVLGSSGNSIFSSLYKVWSLAGVIVAMGVIAISTIVPYFVGVDTSFFYTYDNKYYYQSSSPSPSPSPTTETDNPTSGPSAGTPFPTLTSSAAIPFGFERKLEDEEVDGELVVVTVPYDATNDPYAMSYYLSLGLGCTLVAILVIDFLATIAPRFLCTNPTVQGLVAPSGLKAEASQQKAAFFKTSQMLRNALSNHTENGEGKSGTMRKSKLSERSSSQMQALLKYQLSEVQNGKEEVGGSFWTWKKVFNGSLAREEGVWIHSRLFACAISQLLILIGICFLATLAYENAYQFVYSTNDSIDVQANNLLKKHLNQSFACAGAEFGRIVGTTNQTSRANQVYQTLESVAGGSLLQPLSIDQFMAYDEYWVPGPDAPQIQQVLYEFTIEKIYGCLEQFEVEWYFFWNMTDLRFCVEEIIEYYLYPTDMFKLYQEVDGVNSTDVENILREYCNGTEEYIAILLNTTYDEVEENEDGWSDLAESLELSQVDYKLVVSFAFITSLIVAGFLVFVTIPSYVSQVLRFRAGVIPSLDALDFLKLRKALDATTSLFASSFWGSLFTSLASGVFVGFIVLLFVSPISGELGQKIFAMVVGFVVVLAFRMIVLIALRGRFFTNLYRKNALGANIFFVVLEAWNVALAAGFIITRIIKVLLVSLFFIARIDTAILAPGVGRIGPIELDSFPYSFRKDVVVHEAHRHPYIESFGVLCLLKLRCGESFGNNPHACWRLLFVLALMPWLKKFRESGYIGYMEDLDKIADVGDPPSREELEQGLSALLVDHARSEERYRKKLKKFRNSLGLYHC